MLARLPAPMVDLPHLCLASPCHPLPLSALTLPPPAPSCCSTGLPTLLPAGLEELDLSGNCFKSLPPVLYRQPYRRSPPSSGGGGGGGAAAATLPSLRRLALRHNCFRSIPVEQLAGMLASMPLLGQLELPLLSSDPGPHPPDASGGNQTGSVQVDTVIMRRLQELRPDVCQLADGSLAFLSRAEVAALQSPVAVEAGSE